MLGLLVAQAASAAVVTATANATVQPAGPRLGNNGLANLNIEGTANGTAGSFASFGVVDFSGAAFGLGGASSSISNATLSLVEANAGFTMPATLSFFLASDTAVSIANTVTGTTPDSPLRYQGAATATNGAAAIDPQLGTLIPVGTGSFTTTGNPTGSTGTVDNYLLTLSAAANTYLRNAFQAGTTIRIVVAATETTAAATFGGATNATTTLRPTLTINTPAAVPEPASLAAVGVAGGAALLRRRRATAR